MSKSLAGDRLCRGETLLLDGAIGTELERRGAKVDPQLWCVDAALANYDILLGVHRDYISAGADVITTNTYASSPLILKGTRLEGNFEAVVDRSVEAALEARRLSGRDDVSVAGSVSHMVPGVFGPGAELVSQTEMEDAFGRLAERLALGGVDLILLEMMYHPNRVGPAYCAAAETGLPVWAGFSARQGASGELLAFTREEDLAFGELLDQARSWQVEAAGVMHTRYDLIPKALEAVVARFGTPLYAYPDSGGFNAPNWDFTDVILPKTLLDAAKTWHDLGGRVFGGCCGLGVDHIRALSVLREGKQVR
jgi:homocysteine S-methyltransferase